MSNYTIIQMEVWETLHEGRKTLIAGYTYNPILTASSLERARKIVELAELEDWAILDDNDQVVCESERVAIGSKTRDERSKRKE